MSTTPVEGDVVLLGRSLVVAMDLRAPVRGRDVVEPGCGDRSGDAAGTVSAIGSAPPVVLHHGPRFTLQAAEDNMHPEVIMLVAFSITPLGIGEDVGQAVSESIRVVRASGLPNHTDSMFTTIEGEWDECFDVIRRAVAAVEAVAPRVGLTLKADIRPGVTNAMTSTVATVERYLSEE